MSVLRQIGYSGVHAAQIALTATGQNIANVNTPGFSRLTAQLHSVAGYGRLSVGGGVQVSSIHRFSNDFQNRQLWRATTEQHYYSSAQQYLTALEGLVGSKGSSISAGLDNFFAALSEISSTPESVILRQQILNEAKQLAQRFNGLNGNIKTQIDALHGQRTALVGEMNGLVGNIAELNGRIIELEATGKDTATLRDHRESLIKNLSQYADVRVHELADGSYSVSLANGQPLVVRSTAGQLQINLTAGNEQEVSLKFAEASFPLNQAGIGGVLGGLHDSEYNALRPVQDDLHDMAGALAQLVNDILVTGFDLNGNPGQPLFQYDPNSISGMLTVAALTPEQLAFSSVDPASGDPNEVGNNDRLLELLELKHQTISVAGSQVTLNDAYAGLLGRVASASRQNQADLDSAVTVAQDAQAQRDSVSAVNLDEEAINLMAYSQAYQANMKVIGTSGELFDALLAMF